MDMEAHRALGAHREHNTTEAPSGKKSSGVEVTCLACGSESLTLFRTLKGRAQYECDDCGGVVEIDADRVDGVDGDAGVVA
jgi:transcription elongation factor Elf1